MCGCRGEMDVWRSRDSRPYKFKLKEPLAVELSCRILRRRYTGSIAVPADAAGHGRPSAANPEVPCVRCDLDLISVDFELSLENASCAEPARQQ